MYRRYPTLIKVRKSREDEMMERIRRGDFADIPAESSKPSPAVGEEEEIIGSDEADEEETIVHDET